MMLTIFISKITIFINPGPCMQKAKVDRKVLYTLCQKIRKHFG